MTFAMALIIHKNLQAASATLLMLSTVVFLLSQFKRRWMLTSGGLYTPPNFIGLKLCLNILFLSFLPKLFHSVCFSDDFTRHWLKEAVGSMEWRYNMINHKLFCLYPLILLFRNVNTLPLIAELFSSDAAYVEHLLLEKVATAVSLSLY